MTKVNSPETYRYIMEVARSLDHKMAFRELLKNSVEAGATEVQIGWDDHFRRLGYDKEYREECYPDGAWTPGDTPVFKARVIDNGHGMTPQFMLKYFRELLKTSKSEDTNFGHGGRLSTLFWNPLGVVYVSRVMHGGTPGPWHVAHMVVDHDTESVELVDYDVGDGLTDSVPPVEHTSFTHVVESAGVQRVIGDGPGTVVLLLGRDYEDSTYLLQSRDVSEKIDYKVSHEIFNFLATRFAELQNPHGQKLGEDLQVRVLTIHSANVYNVWEGNKSLRPASKSKRAHEDQKWREGNDRRRKIRPVRSWVGNGRGQTVIDSGTMEVPKARAILRWWFTSPPAKSVSGGNGPTHGLIGYSFEGEFYEIHARTTENTSHPTHCRLYGLDFAEVSDRVYIEVEFQPAKLTREHAVIEPGVHPSLDRMRLEWRSSERRETTKLPYQAIGAEFKKNMPDVIEKALAEACKHNSKDVDSSVVAELKKTYDFGPTYIKSKSYSGERGKWTTSDWGNDGQGGNLSTAPKGLRGPRSTKGTARSQSGGGNTFTPSPNGAEHARRHRDPPFLSAVFRPENEIEDLEPGAAGTIQGDLVVLNQDFEVVKSVTRNALKNFEAGDGDFIRERVMYHLKRQVTAQVNMFLQHRATLKINLSEPIFGPPGAAVFDARMLALMLANVEGVVPRVKEEARRQRLSKAS